MIQQYVDKFIENLPEEFKNNKQPLKIDLVLDGGLFNGSYLVGALYFLKEMEKRNYVKIYRISGCSIGSVIAFIYMIDCLDICEVFYDIMLKQLNTHNNLSAIKQLYNLLEDKIPDDICNKINDKFYITYYNIKRNKKIVKKKYRNKKDIINSIIKSSYIPFFIDGETLYENKYIDGINPYIFKIKKNRKILYLDLFGYNKLQHLINIKNEKTNFHRILTGLLDIHNFYIKQTNTEMCSYVNDWSITNKSRNLLKIIIEIFVLYIVFLIIFIKTYIPIQITDSIFFKILSKIIYEIYLIVLHNYCV
jgi:hypothetical protein